MSSPVLARLQTSGPAPLEYSSPARSSSSWQTAQNWYTVIKPTIDFLLAGLILVLVSPVIFLAAFLVKLTSRGPAIYCQTRVGKDNKPFTIYKLRTMHHDCEKRSGAQWSTPGDPRITPLGNFLRRSRIDELPQLMNVLRGEMSLVGPRPERPEFVPELDKVIPHYKDRHLVRPGITGLAQIQLPADTDLDSVRRKLAFDLLYVQKCNAWLDFRILICTPIYAAFGSAKTLLRLFGIPSMASAEKAYHHQATNSGKYLKIHPV